MKKPTKTPQTQLAATLSRWALELGQDDKTLKRSLLDAGIKLKPRELIQARQLFAALHGDSKTARARLTLAMAKRQELALERDRKSVVLWEDAHRQAAEAMAYLFGELDRSERELPPELKGMDEIEILTRLKAFYKDVRKRAREKFDQVAGAQPKPDNDQGKETHV